MNEVIVDISTIEFPHSSKPIVFQSGVVVMSAQDDSGFKPRLSVLFLNE